MQVGFKTNEKCNLNINLKEHSTYNSFKTIIPFIANKSELQELINKRNLLQRYKKKKYLSNEKINKTNITKTINSTALKNTLFYIFYKIGYGIFVKIHNNKLIMFKPIYNIEYKNDWSSDITFNNAESISEYLKKKRPDSYQYDISKWSATGCLPNIWNLSTINDQRWAEFYDMFNELCKNVKLNNIEFIINYKDFPILRTNLTEPNFFMYDDMNKKLTSHKYNIYLPILSVFSSKLYTDIMIPSYSEWKTLTKLYYVSNSRTPCINKVANINSVLWNKKIATAVFRGGASGCGITIDSNQRLKVAYLNQQYKNDENYNEKNQIDKIPFLDAGITSYTYRDKKNYKKPIDIINIKKLNIPRLNFIEKQNLQLYKYTIYIDGNVAAERLITELNSGSVILKVESLYGWEQWFHKYLKPNIHYIPVKKDLSDLMEKIKWCKLNDTKCIEIVNNAKEIFTKINNKKYIFKYLQHKLNNL